ncbi:MAG: hypothetical protein PUB87_02790 [Eubacteriaceae bacterium]|nr:hypothetical protein [Eubacteriaceae bacterium]
MKYENRSDMEILQEIKEMRSKLNAAGVPYEKQAAMIKSLMPMMNNQQKARLAKLIELLDK